MPDPNFYRKVIKLPSNQFGSTRRQIRSSITHQESKEHQDLQETAIKRVENPNVLVINGSTDMASAITRQLLIALPHANIMYAPTIELAGWILKTRQIQLIISSEILPDGGAHKLHSVLTKLRIQPPDLLMVGNSVRGSVQQLRKVGYKLVQRKTISGNPIEQRHSPIQRRRSLPLTDRVSSLSADLRNDLNNPLQEIVTMAFVARQSREQQELSHDALLAIERAATQLAGTVSGLEDRIKKAVS